MINLEQQLPDPLTDNAGILIKALQDRTTWGAEQKGLFEQLILMLGRKRYISFVGHPARYHLSQIGQSCLMDVPTNKRGHLIAFRGKRIRLVCVAQAVVAHHVGQRWGLQRQGGIYLTNRHGAGLVLEMSQGVEDVLGADPSIRVHCALPVMTGARRFNCVKLAL